MAIEIAPAFVPGSRLAGPLALLLAHVVGIWLGWWIYRDAKSRGSDWAWQWGTGIALLIVAGAFPVVIGWGAGIALLSIAGLLPSLVGLSIYFRIRDPRAEPA